MKVAVQYHDDSDGKASARIMLEYLMNKYQNPKIDFYRGSSPIIPIKYDLYIFLDVGTRNLKFINKAYGKAGKTWVFDHHLPVNDEYGDVDLFMHSPRGISTSQLVYRFYRREFGGHPRLAFVSAIGGISDGYEPTRVELKDASEKYGVRLAPAYKGPINGKLKTGLLLATSNIKVDVIESAPNVNYKDFDCESYPEVCRKTIVYKGLPIYSYTYHRRKGIKMVYDVKVDKFRVVKKTDEFVILSGTEKALIIASNHYFDVPVIGRFTKGYMILSGSGDAYKFATKYTDRAYGRDKIAFIEMDDIGIDFT